jgi:hypothetical protein
LINVYGPDPDTKWTTLLARLKTNGNVLFVSYKYAHLMWSVWLIMQKLALMIFLTLSNRLNVWLMLGVPIVDIIFAIVTGVKRPYNYPAENFLDCLCFSLNFLYSLIPIVERAGVDFSIDFMSYLTIAIAAIPFLFLVVFLCWKKPAFVEGDPTVRTELTDDEVERRVKIIGQKQAEKKRLEAEYEKLRAREKTLKRAKNSNRRSGNAYGDGAEQNYGHQLAEVQNRMDAIRKHDGNEWPYIFPEDDVEVSRSSICSIHDARVAAIAETIGGEKSPLLVADDEPITVNRRRLAEVMDQMYAMLDLVLDGSTIETILGALNGAMLLGALAFGWFAGALMALDVPSTYRDYDCS